jgi:hypothetical protein
MKRSSKSAKMWADRLVQAKKQKEDWMKTYKVEALIQYYQGFQWANQDDEYVVNMFWSTLEVKLPSMMFTNPVFYCNPKPSQLKVDSQKAYDACDSLQDALTDWTADEKNKFSDEAEIACLEAFFGFAVVEIGYSAKFNENPNAQKPEIIEGKSAGQTTYKDPPYLVEDEAVFVKQISFQDFIVCANPARYLDQCDWFGYKEMMLVDDLLADKNIKSKDELQQQYLSRGSQNTRMGTGLVKPEAQKFDSFVDPDKEYVTVWKLWDMRSKKKVWYVEESELEVFTQKFKYHPFETLMYRRPMKGFYPKPYTFDWVPLQNEINETRETHKMHRRKFRRQFTLKQGAAELDDVKALINGPDGGVIEVTGDDPLRPVPNADLGQSATLTMQVSKDDFNIVSGTTSEQRGEADRVTATAANITNQRAQVRESRERTLVGKWLVRVAKKILVVMRDNLANEFDVIKQPKEEMMTDLQTRPEVRTIDPLTDMGDKEFDFDVLVSVESMSPVQNQEEYTKMINFFSVLKQFPEFSLSPTIIREIAFKVGYKNAQVIQELQKMAQLALIAKAGGPPQSGSPQQNGANMQEQVAAMQGQAPQLM